MCLCYLSRFFHLCSWHPSSRLEEIANKGYEIELAKHEEVNRDRKYFHPLSSILSTFIHVIHFHSLSFNFIQLHPPSSTFIRFHQLSSTFIHFYPISSTFTHFYPLSSNITHFYSLLFTFFHFFSLTECTKFSETVSGYDTVGNKVFC